VKSLPVVVALLILGAPPSIAPPTIRRHFTRADRDTGRYQYVPVEVAAGVTELTISYRYSGDGGGETVVDLGLFEPGPLSLGTRAFRGYSGGSQRTVTIARDHATPGYLPGPIPAGQWHVLLGLYQVAPDGVDVDIDVTTTSGANPARPGADTPATSMTMTATPAGPRWFSGGLHVHTTHSDGQVGPNATAEAARLAGLDFIAITDHNNTTHRLEPVASNAPLRIVGEEVTTPSGHANVWGLRPGAWVDFRVKPDEPGAAAKINGLVDTAHKAGALVSINHPFVSCAGCAWKQTMPDDLDAIEIWNGEKGPQPEAIQLWDQLLRKGRRVVAVGASDWHHGPEPIDSGSVRVFAKTLTERDVLDAIHHGHVMVMRSARDLPPSITVRCGKRQAGVGESLACTSGDAVLIDVALFGLTDGRVELIWNGERVSSKPLAASGAAFAFPAEPGYARLHVFAADGSTIAVSNPVYVTTR
jgi:hypothetical protein